jgi:hypothetical protein
LCTEISSETFPPTSFGAKVTSAVMRGAMRDIRSDLQERANLVEEEITAAVAYFEKTVQRLQSECDARVAQLRAELAVLGVLMESEQQRIPNASRQMESEQQRMPNASRQSEHQRMRNGPRPIESEHQRIPNGPRPMALPRQTLADFIARKLAETGPGSNDDLSSFAIQEGYFPDTESARPGVHATLIDLLRSDRIRQLPDGTHAPATLAQMIRRQAV